MGNLSLKVPSLEDLSYREKFMLDPETMQYNAGYDIELEGYNKETGTIEFNQENWQDWHLRWVAQKPNKYYAYIVRKSDNTFIGDVAFRYDEKFKMHIINIVLEAKYRGKGYSKEALKLLSRVAFEEYNLDVFGNLIPKERISADKSFKNVGFVDSGKINKNIKFGMEETSHLLILTKEKYFLENS